MPRSKFKLKDRYVIEDGIATIRPMTNGRPGPTPKEADIAIAKFEAVMKDHWGTPEREYKVWPKQS